MAFYRFIFWCPISLVMVLSCSVYGFLSPSGLEIRLRLCKRIFYFSFFPLLGIFPSCLLLRTTFSVIQFGLFFPWHFFSCCSIWYKTDICPLVFSTRELREMPFFSNWKDKFIVSVTLTHLEEVQLLNEDPSLNTGCFHDQNG